jgi:hypothetical protein
VIFTRRLVVSCRSRWECCHWSHGFFVCRCTIRNLSFWREWSKRACWCESSMSVDLSRDASARLLPDPLTLSFPLSVHTFSFLPKENQGTKMPVCFVMGMHCFFRSILGWCVSTWIYSTFCRSFPILVEYLILFSKDEDESHCESLSSLDCSRDLLFSSLAGLEGAIVSPSYWDFSSFFLENDSFSICLLYVCRLILFIKDDDQGHWESLLPLDRWRDLPFRLLLGRPPRLWCSFFLNVIFLEKDIRFVFNWCLMRIIPRYDYVAFSACYRCNPLC